MDKLYTRQLQLNANGCPDDDKFAYYEWVLSSTSLNSYYFHMSLEALKSMRKGLNANSVPLMIDHHYTVHNVIGRVTSARLRDNSELIGNLRIEKDKPMAVGTTNDLINSINLESITDGSIGYDFNDGYFKCDKCSERMELFMGFAFCDNGHFLGEPDEKGNQRITAELMGNITIYEFSLAYVGADPSAEKVSELQKFMTEHNLGAGALQAASELQNYHYGNLCQTLGLNPKHHRATHRQLSHTRPLSLSEISDRLYQIGNTVSRH